eukprot:gene9674-11469_t
METVYEISPRSDATSPRSEVVVAGLLSEETSPRSVVIVTGPESTSTSPATLDNTAEANESSLSLVLFEVDAREADVEHTQEAESDEPRHTSWDLKSGTVVTCEFNETGYHNPEEQHELLWDTTKHLMKTGFQRTLQTKNFVLYSRDEDGIESNVAQRLDRFHEVLEDSELVDQSPAARKFLASPVYAYLVNTNARLHKDMAPLIESEEQKVQHKLAESRTFVPHFVAEKGLKLSDTRSWMMPVRFLTKIETPLKLEEASKKDEDEEGELGLFRLATFGRSAKDSQRVHPVGDSSTHNSSPTEIPVDRPQFGEVSNKEAIEETESNKAASEPEEEDANMATTWEVIAFTFLWLWEFESSNALVCFGAVSYQAAFAATQILLVNLLVSEEVVGNGEDVSPDFMLMSCYVLALLVSSMANIRSQYVLANALPSGGGFIPAVQHMYVVHVCNLSQTYLDTIPKAEIQSVIENSVTQMNLNIDALFFLMLAIGQLTSVLAVLFVIFPPMALLVLCLLPIFALISRGKSGQVGTESLKLTESKRDFSNCMYEMIGATVPNKLMGKPQIMMERLQDGASLVEDGYDRVDLRVSENVRNMNFSSLLLLLSNIILGVVMMGVGDIDAAAFISFVMGVQSMMDIIKTTAGLFAYFQVSRGSLSDMMRLARASIDDPPPGKVVDPLSQYAIEMSNMDFSYGAARGEVSNKPQMAIPLARFPAGKKVGVVGKSGSGKSTLMKLINGVYKPTNGKLYYFGVEDTSVYTPNLISVIEQEVLLFDGTIKQNLLWSVGEK